MNHPKDTALIAAFRNVKTELEAHVTLTDQRRVRIRALHSREEQPIRELHARLSPRNRY